MALSFIGITAVLLQIAFLLLSPIFHIALGRRAALLVSRIVPTDEQSIGIPNVVFYVFGLLCHLVAIFLLKATIDLPWVVATFLPLLPVIIKPGELRSLIRDIKFPTSFNFVLWFAVSLGLGVSLLQAVEGIKTPWTNNYGDLTFHVGMITSFVLGDNFPSEYHIFSGVKLSYPVFINIWTASYWWLSTTFRALGLIFTIQWVFLWSAIYFLLRGDKFRLLPWALLLGGGSYFTVFQNSGTLIRDNGAWTVFLTTIWVTQRAALLGVCVELAAISLLFLSVELRSRSIAASRYTLVLSGLIIAFSPLAHTHICLVTLLYAGMFVFFKMISQALKSGWEGAKEEVLDFAYFCASCAPGLLFIPWLLGKEGSFRPIFGWTTGLNPAELGDRMFTLHKSLNIWLGQAWPWILIVALVWIFTKAHRKFIPALIIFILGNLYVLAEWDWDQLKIFLGIYGLTLIILACEYEKRSVHVSQWLENTPHALSLIVRGFSLSLQALPILLVIPATLEVGGIIHKGENFEVYNKEKMDRAQAIVEKTDKHAIIVGGPDHNSLVTLTGRRLFYGYEGTLSSHGLDYGRRRELMGDLEQLAKCAELNDPKIPHQACPDYLLWTNDERRYFKQRDEERKKTGVNYDKPGPGFVATELEYLYRLEKQK